ncbi:MAG: hypothetical protein AB7I79_12945 [Rhizobiaceae bacterium]
MAVRRITRVIAAASALALPPSAWGTASAQETASAALRLELNALQPFEKGCRLTFVVENRLGGDLQRAAFELALFDSSGVVDRLTVLDFRDMPEGKTKVSRFDLSGVDCAGVSRVLVNHANECQGEGIAPEACMRQLETSTKTQIVFGA